MPVSTARTIYFKNSAGCVWEEPQGYVRLDYNTGLREETQFRALLMHARQALRRHGWSKMLVNQQQMSGYSPNEEKWLITEWLPQAVHDDGYRYGALIVAHDVFARLSTTSLVLSSRQLGHVYRNFEHEAEAMAWLLSVQ